MNGQDLTTSRELKFSFKILPLVIAAGIIPRLSNFAAGGFDFADSIDITDVRIIAYGILITSLIFVPIYIIRTAIRKEAVISFAEFVLDNRPGIARTAIEISKRFGVSAVDIYLLFVLSVISTFALNSLAAAIVLAAIVVVAIFSAYIYIARSVIKFMKHSEFAEQIRSSGATSRDESPLIDYLSHHLGVSRGFAFDSILGIFMAIFLGTLIYPKVSQSFGGGRPYSAQIVTHKGVFACKGERAVLVRFSSSNTVGLSCPNSDSVVIIKRDAIEEIKIQDRSHATVW